MEEHREFTADEARAIGERIGIDWNSSQFDVEQLRMGLGVELEHGRRDPATNVTDDDEVTTGKIAWAHLNEFPDYYTRLDKMEADADRYWAERERDPEGHSNPTESPRRGHPGEEGDPTAGPAVPEDQDVVPGRHSASAEAAWLRWRETHDDN
jgi:hypothetical protein